MYKNVNGIIIKCRGRHEMHKKMKTDKKKRKGNHKINKKMKRNTRK